MSGFTRSRSKPILIDQNTQQEAIKKYLEGASKLDLARFYGCSSAYLDTLFKRHSIKIRSSREQQNLNSPINLQHDEIIARYKTGESIRSISKSLGIYHTCVSALLTKEGILVRKGSHRHGQHSTPTYQIWKGLSRNRGLPCCLGWSVWISFHKDVGDRPGDEMVFSRPDKLRAFACGHCEECTEKGANRNGDWLPPASKSGPNKHSNLIEYKGETKPILHWARETGLHHMTIFRRLAAGWSIERALTTPSDSTANQPHRQGHQNPQTIDLRGCVFGKLTVLEMIPPTPKKPVKWLCKCQCGEKTEVKGFQLRGGITKSCGCLIGVNYHKEPGKKITSHPLYVGWRSILHRCKKDADYAGRGIDVCARWSQSFLHFLEDMGDRPREGMSIDRIDNEGGYWCGHCAECIEKNRNGNCRWATAIEQSRNKRNVRSVTIGGIARSVPEWAEITGNSSSTINYRIRKGWDPVDAVTLPTKY